MKGFLSLPGAVAAVVGMAAAATSGAAAAQDWAPIRAAAGGPGTMVCPAAHGATGNRVCFGLRCRAGQPMQWTISLDGGALPASGEVTVTVDGAAVGSFAFTSTANAPRAGAAPYSSVRHAGIADALKRGRHGRLVVSGLPRPVAISLNGARRQIERTFRLCRVPEGAPSRPMPAAPAQ